MARVTHRESFSEGFSQSANDAPHAGRVAHASAPRTGAIQGACRSRRALRRRAPRLRPPRAPPTRCG